jgi:hypothetical protein
MLMIDDACFANTEVIAFRSTRHFISSGRETIRGGGVEWPAVSSTAAGHPRLDGFFYGVAVAVSRRKDER